METTNIILTIVGVFVLLIGLISFFNPSWTRWINFPGGPRLKAIVALIVGIILTGIGLLLPLSN